jgi:hypothetical protein
MFSGLTEKAAADFATIRKIVSTSDSLRVVLARAVGGMRPLTAVETELERICGSGPTLVDWKVYDHSAAMTRLYAIYELFVHDLVRQWLELLPIIYANYAELPGDVCDSYRLGIAEILPRVHVNGDRYPHLSELDVVSGFTKGLNSKKYSLLFEAFATDQKNLWRDTLHRLFKRCGINNVWEIIANHGSMQKYLTEQCGDGATADSELESIVKSRNEAAHGVPDSIVSAEKVAQYSDYLTILCGVLAEAVQKSYITRLLDLGNAVEVGAVIREFSDCVVGVRASRGTIWQGAECFVLREYGCIKGVIQSIEVNGDSCSGLSITNQLDIGLGLNVKAKENARIVVPLSGKKMRPSKVKRITVKI